MAFRVALSAFLALVVVMGIDAPRVSSGCRPTKQLLGTLTPNEPSEAGD